MITMYDDINVALIPADAQAVAGYVNGRWPTYQTIVSRFPHAKHLSIAVTSTADADCLDVELGDATNGVAAGWVKRQLARTVKRPVIYTSVSNAAALIRALAAEGVQRSQIRLWTAHYTGKPHLCGPPCGFGMPTTADATQYNDKALGRSLDVSVCRDDFFAVAPTPKPKPAPAPKPQPKPTPAPPPPVFPADPMFYVWVAWRTGTGMYAAYGAQNRDVRPTVDYAVPQAWYTALSLMANKRPRPTMFDRLR